jgi:hypothetical protein
VACNVVFLLPYIYWWPVTLFSSFLTFIGGRRKTTLQATNKCKEGGKQRYSPPINVRKEENNVTGHQYWWPVTLFSSFLTLIGGL